MLMEQPRLCTLEGCTAKLSAAGLCSTHYSRKRRSGTTDPPPSRIPRLCNVEGCESKHSSKGYCTLHYSRLVTKGTTHKDPFQNELHGNIQAYHAGCRCRECKNANNLANKKARAKRVPPPEGDPRHGKPSTYSNWNCRCAQCTESHRVKCKEAYDVRKAAGTNKAQVRNPTNKYEMKELQDWIRQ